MKIAEPQAEQAKPMQRVEEEEKIGLPQLIKVYASAGRRRQDDLGDSG